MNDVKRPLLFTTDTTYYVTLLITPKFLLTWVIGYAATIVAA